MRLEKQNATLSCGCQANLKTLHLTPSAKLEVTRYKGPCWDNGVVYVYNLFLYEDGLLEKAANLNRKSAVELLRPLAY